MEINVQMIQPIVTLVVWSLIIMCWLYATRIPAIVKMKIKMDSDAPSGEMASKLPPNVRWKADNYNHLMEQPTLFYALAFSLAILGEGTAVNVSAAWLYVILRIIHSLIQVLGNKIKWRFVVFMLSNIPLMILTFNALVAVF